jgi:hypothetical protein
MSRVPAPEAYTGHSWSRGPEVSCEATKVAMPANASGVHRIVVEVLVCLDLPKKMCFLLCEQK